jgi:hypothetical protein
MPIVASDLQFWSSASIPTDDASTSGGAISTTKRPALDLFSAAAVVALVSSEAGDARNVTVVGRDAAGAIISEVKALNGTTEVVTAAQFRDVHSVTAAATHATRVITVRQGAGGTQRGQIIPNTDGIHAMFQRSASEAGAVDRYEKQFAKNNHASLTLNSAAIKLTADNADKIFIGCASAVNDSGSVANRKTAPPGVTFVDLNVSQAVPGGALAAQDRIGIWVKQSLGAVAGAFRDSFTIELSGTTMP